MIETLESVAPVPERRTRRSTAERPSVASKLSFASGRISVVSFEPTTADETPWASIYVTSALAFCQAIQFTLYFCPIWSYLQFVSVSLKSRKI